MKLSDLQKRFVNEYVIDVNGTQAAIRAGYSKKGASVAANRLLRNDKILKAIDDLMSEKNEKLVAKQDEVLKLLTQQARRESIDYQVILTDAGVKTIELPTENKDAIKALELLGKRYAMWTEKIDQTNTNIEINVGEWDDD